MRAAGLLLLAAAPVLAQDPPPMPRPAALAPAAAAGPVCGLGGIVGVPAPSVAERGGCAMDDAATVTEVAGIGLSPAPTLRCETFRALSLWLESAAKPAFAGLGGGLAGLDVAAAYVCRTTNNQPGTRISQHALGRAIDIGAFRLRDGGSVAVGEASGRAAQAVGAARSRACGPFTTTLGPGSDAYHETHLHLDIAERRRPYCR